MSSLILDIEKDYKKPAVVAVRSGDVVKVTQRIQELNKERLQVFEGLVIRVDRANSLTYRITVRKITAKIGVEKSFLMHSPNVVKVEVLKRSKVRRNYLSYMRQRIGKAARLKSMDFDKQEVNKVSQVEVSSEKKVESEQVVDKSVQATEKPAAKSADTVLQSSENAKDVAPQSEDTEEEVESDTAEEIATQEEDSSRDNLDVKAEDDQDETDVPDEEESDVQTDTSKESSK